MSHINCAVGPQALTVAPCGASLSSADQIHPPPLQANTAMSPAKPECPWRQSSCFVWQITKLISFPRPQHDVPRDTDLSWLLSTGYRYTPVSNLFWQSVQTSAGLEFVLVLWATQSECSAVRLSQTSITKPNRRVALGVSSSVFAQHLHFANTWHLKRCSVTFGVMPGTSEGIFLVVSWPCKWLWLKTTLGRKQNSANCQGYPSSFKGVIRDNHWHKMLNTLEVCFKKRNHEEMQSDLQSESMADLHCRSRLCLPGYSLLVWIYIFTKAVLSCLEINLKENLGFLRRHPPHCSFPYAVSNFQVVSNIVNFSQYCFCSNIFILHAFIISHS